MAARTGVLLLVMDARLPVMVGDDQRLAMEAGVRLRAATAEELPVAAVHRTEAVDHMVAADMVDMGGRIALDFFPA